MEATTAVVVLAGGTSRRFGSDKLTAPVDGSPLLDAALAALPDDADVVLVGPARPTARSVHLVREDPPGGGPAAALVAGLRLALTGPATLLAVLPGDAPAGGRAAVALLGLLRDDPSASALVAVDDEGRDQPLQLALRRPAAEALVASAADGGQGASARRLLLAALGPDLRRVPLPPSSLFDVDTPAQLAAWAAQTSPQVAALVALAERSSAGDRPVVLALDGPSGAGKSTLAAALRLRTGATVLPGDDFYAVAFAESDLEELGRLDDGELADRVFDWARLRAEALVPLAAGRPARYRPFDWTGTAGPGRLGAARSLPPAPLVVLDGVYAARPELADLVTASVLVRAEEIERAARLAARGDDPRWAGLWERAERHYFTHVRTAADVDLVLG